MDTQNYSQSIHFTHDEFRVRRFKATIIRLTDESMGICIGPCDWVSRIYGLSVGPFRRYPLSHIQSVVIEELFIPASVKI